VEGEAGFRKRENDVISELVKMNGIILSVGGGAVTSDSIRQQLIKNGIVVYLKVSIEKQMQRIMTSKHARPLLKQYNNEEKLTTLNKTREPLYLEIADLQYETDGFKPNELAELIVADVKTLIKKLS
jgi:shikimate kinase